MSIALPRLLLALSLLAAAGPALALYKVVGADGRITYTDRPPAAGNARVTTLGRNGEVGAADDEASLPFELRQVAARFPVTLYTSAECPPCDSGRQLLQQRGVPFVERRVASEDDAAALERVVGGRTVPALTIGKQALRGLSPAEWTSFLDAAGYPKVSTLPRSYQPPPAVPLLQRAPLPARVPAEPQPAAPAPPDTAVDGGIRF